ncbi:Conserved_hypothetical protein [Hexamita inflata]|uniref:Uncharacterized protein n=1 Tax=Hexamita inflata TaxID=28002 RepID=A0AA86TN41_9EUKA|nr:Conserved hypothetical protein [Hexamita inflata]CAI9938917.1 Conserved hypothetical protein [Hexamita inflata]
MQISITNNQLIINDTQLPIYRLFKNKSTFYVVYNNILYRINNFSLVFVIKTENAFSFQNNILSLRENGIHILQNTFRTQKWLRNGLNGTIYQFFNRVFKILDGKILKVTDEIEEIINIEGEIINTEQKQHIIKIITTCNTFQFNMITEKIIDREIIDYKETEEYAQEFLQSMQNCDADEKDTLDDKRHCFLKLYNKNEYLSVHKGVVCTYNQQMQIIEQINKQYDFYPIIEGYANGEELDIMHNQYHQLVYCGETIYMHFYDYLFEIDLQHKQIKLISKIYRHDYVYHQNQYPGVMFTLNNNLYLNNKFYQLYVLNNGILKYVQDEQYLQSTYFQFCDQIVVYEDLGFYKVNENLKRTNIYSYHDSFALQQFSSVIVAVAEKLILIIDILSGQMIERSNDQRFSPQNINNFIILGDNGKQLTKELLKELFGEDYELNVFQYYIRNCQNLYPKTQTTLLDCQLMCINSYFPTVNALIQLDGNEINIIKPDRTIIHSIQSDFNLFSGVVSPGENDDEDVQIINPYNHHLIQSASDSYLQRFNKVYLLKDWTVEFVDVIPSLPIHANFSNNIFILDGVLHAYYNQSVYSLNKSNKFVKAKSQFHANQTFTEFYQFGDLVFGIASSNICQISKSTQKIIFRAKGFITVHFAHCLVLIFSVGPEYFIFNCLTLKAKTIQKFDPNWVELTKFGLQLKQNILIEHFGPEFSENVGAFYTNFGVKNTIQVFKMFNSWPELFVDEQFEGVQARIRRIGGEKGEMVKNVREKVRETEKLVETAARMFSNVFNGNFGQ